MAKGEGRESPCPDAVISTTAKDVTTTEQSGNAKTLLHILEVYRTEIAINLCELN